MVVKSSRCSYCNVGVGQVSRGKGVWIWGYWLGVVVHRLDVFGRRLGTRRATPPAAPASPLPPRPAACFRCIHSSEIRIAPNCLHPFVLPVGIWIRILFGILFQFQLKLKLVRRMGWFPLCGKCTARTACMGWQRSNILNEFHSIAEWSQSFQRVFEKILWQECLFSTAYLVTKWFVSIKSTNFSPIFRQQFVQDFSLHLLSHFYFFQSLFFIFFRNFRPEMSDFFRCIFPVRFYSG